MTILTIVCVVLLMMVAVLEMACSQGGHEEIRGARRIMAVACMLLVIRLSFLLATKDLGRLNEFGMIAIAMMAFSRILACSWTLHYRGMAEDRQDKIRQITGAQ